jgi:succinate dehydrogenase (ubiquinone) membrane anchor subunit
MHPVLDSILCAMLVAHSHVGFQYVQAPSTSWNLSHERYTMILETNTSNRSCIIDYFPKKRVPKTRVTLEWTLRVATLLTLIGLYEFETNDVGLAEGIKRVWKA